MNQKNQKKTDKILLLIRHADRDTSHKEQDNGLSERGHTQAIELARTLQERYALRQHSILYSSPKRRCIETLEPLSKAIATPIKTNPLLSEQTENEVHSKVQERIKTFIQHWMHLTSPSIVIACSHGDWLPLAVEKLTGTSVEFQKADYVEIYLQDENPQIRFPAPVISKNQKAAHP